MRKVDYAFLAYIISRGLRNAEKANDPNVVTALTNLAIDFAGGASVDKAAFLIACGIG